MITSYRGSSLVLCIGLLVGSGAARAAEDFPEITPEEKAFQKFAAEPQAPIVTLSRRAEFWMMDIAKGDVSSRYTVRERRKVLTTAGADRADVRVVHNKFVRLSNFKGRTVLPDGTVVPLPKDAQFKATASRSQRLFVTSVAFPGVVQGAILDYSYEMRWDSIFFLDPFYFQQDVPVLSAEILYHVPGTIQARGWRWDPINLGIQIENKTERGGVTLLRAWAANLPSVPDEPSSPPFGDMAAQMMLIPVAYKDASTFFPLMGDWSELCRLFHDEYQYARDREGGAPERARQLAAGAATPLAKAEALYRFVRDEIATEGGVGVGLRKGVTVGDTLKKARGDAADKALLLQRMLQALKIDSQLVWVADRAGGRVDAAVPNPAWFDRPIVRLSLDGQLVHLDPSDPSLAFGHLAPGLHGTTAVVFDRKKPETVVLPVSTLTNNTRSVTLDLAVDDEGNVTGKGSMVMTGAHAWSRTRWLEGETETREGWKKWLEAGFPDYTVSDIQHRELVDPAPPKVEVEWTLKLREEKLLPDEVTVVPSQPLGPIRASTLFPAAGRRTPIHLAYADRDDVEVRVTWPEGWRVEASPRPVDYDNLAGGVVLSVEIDAEGRRAVAKRRIDVKQAVAGTRDQVAAMKSAYAEFEKSDAQTLLLVRH